MTRSHRIVILVCPCCASPVDAATYLCDGIAVGEQDQPFAECGTEKSHPAHPMNTEQQFECLACGQTWRMVVDPHRLAQHSLT